MTAWTTVPDGGAPGPEPSARRFRGAIAVLAGVAQLGVLAFTFLLGLGWGGLTYLAALLQAAAALGVIARLAGRKGGSVLLVPVLSAALTAALAIAGQAHGRATACSDDEDGAQMLEVVVGEPPGASPCLVNTVDYLERRTVSEV